MTAPTPGPAYDERLTAPWWCWPLGVGLSVLVAAQVHSGADGFGRAVLPYLLLPVLAVAVLLLLSRGRVRIADGVLHVPGARMPLSATGRVAALDAEQTRLVRGPVADPRAHVATRPWLSRAVRVEVVDPDDDTPYWLIGTRQPGELAAALAAARS